jgi:dihydropteroate synthase
VDVGGESTRPGAAAVPADEELARVVPAIVAIRKRCGDEVVITIDTTKAAVAKAALDAGADAINDVSGGGADRQMLALAADRKAGMILMHRLRTPQADVFSTQYAPGHAPTYTGVEPTLRLPGVVTSVRRALEEMRDRAMAAGVAADGIVLDPGLGFGKSVEDNLQLIQHTGALLELGSPILSALSRKSFTAPAAGLPAMTPPAGRLFGTLGLSARHLAVGARLFRVHDVACHVQMLRAMWRTR